MTQKVKLNLKQKGLIWFKKKNKILVTKQRINPDEIDNFINAMKLFKIKINNKKTQSWDDPES